MIRLFHRHRYDLRESRPDGRYLVCACGSAVPMLTRDTPVTVTPPAHETMKAQRADSIEVQTDNVLPSHDDEWSIFSLNIGPASSICVRKVH